MSPVSTNGADSSYLEHRPNRGSGRKVIAAIVSDPLVRKIHTHRVE
jgi:hypothetical protein